MTTLRIHLPDSLHSMASQDHVSMNQFIASAVAEKISATATETYLKERADRATQQKFEATLAAVPAQTPDARDVM